MGLKPHAVRPQRPFLSYMDQSACVDTVSVERSKAATAWQHWAVLGTFLEKLARNFPHLV